MKHGNAYKFKRLYGAKGGNPRDHSVYICVLRLNAVRSLYCIAGDAGVQFNLTNGVVATRNNKKLIQNVLKLPLALFLFLSLPLPFFLSRSVIYKMAKDMLPK